MPKGVYKRTAKHRAAAAKGSLGNRNAAGSVRSKEYRAKQVKAQTGKRHSAATRAKMSKSHTGKKFPFRKRVPTSDATKAKLSAMFKGRPGNPVCLKALRDALPGHTRTQGSKHGMSKLTEKKVREIHRRAWKGEYQEFIAECFGIGAPYVSMIKNGYAWSHLNLNKETI